ncbi:MAG: thiamine-phosphate kinase [Pseudomonadota bacterium]
MSEFDLIARYFSGFDRDAEIGVGDDAAVVAIPDNKRVVVATDTTIEGVHFPKDTPPDAVGFRALAVNLSDLAAMGATPQWFTLALTIPNEDAAWLRAFSDSLLGLANRFGVGLIGGDTTRGPLSITITVFGVADEVIVRSGASPGDTVWLGGRPGDAAAGLACWARRNESDDDIRYLVDRFLFPEPQIALGQALVGRASAAIDISDGLVADLGHICHASGCGAKIQLDQLPLSDALQGVVGEVGARSLALSGGDDYVLLFTAAPTLAFESCFAIGEMTTRAGVALFDRDTPYELEHKGYAHF